jgi:hypothetical protein
LSLSPLLLLLLLLLLLPLLLLLYQSLPPSFAAVAITRLQQPSQQEGLG